MASENSRRSRAARSFGLTAFGHRCPACESGALFRSRYEMHDRCPACGQDLLGVDGAQYGGPIVLGYTVAGVSGLGTIGLLWGILGYATWQLWAAIAVTCVAVFLTFRHCKASWTWLLWATGQLGDDVGGGSGRRDPGPGDEPTDGPAPHPDVQLRRLVRRVSRVRPEPVGGPARDPRDS